MTKRSLFALALALALAAGLAGCGGGTDPVLQAGAPHRGVAIKLPESRGYAELVFEPVASPPARMAPTELVVYFFRPDLATPLEPPPTDVSLVVVDPESRQKTPRALKPAPKAGDPAGSARFASGPVDRDYSQLPIGGELKANAGGPITAPF